MIQMNAPARVLHGIRAATGIAFTLLAAAPAFGADASAAPASAPVATTAPASTAPAAATTTPARKMPARKAAAVDPASVDPKVKTSAGTGKNSRALDRLDLDTTQITGNRELPKVMVVVPWKKSDIGDLVGRPVNSLVDEALQPVDREVFRREVDYYGALAPDRQSSGPTSGPASDGAAAPSAAGAPGAATAPATRSETGVTPGAGSARPEK